MTAFEWAMITGAAILLLGFMIGWNAAFYIMWRHNKQRAAELKRKIFET